MSFNNDGKIARLDNGVTGASLAPQIQAGLPFQLRLSDDDVEELQQKRMKDGLCPKCGEVRTHRTNLRRLVPEVRALLLKCILLLSII